MRPPGRVPAAQAGFALPAVLAILIVVAGAAAITAERLRTRAGHAGNQARSLRLQGLADGVARLVANAIVMERLRGLPGLGLASNGTAVACQLPRGRRVTLTVQDHAGLIDLNTSPRPLLEAAFRASGIGDATALTLAAEVVDYRDPDEMPEPNGGAETPQYRSRGLSYGPRDGPFTSVDEIERLPSMTPEIAARLRPVLTVYNPSRGVDPGLVPVPALMQSVTGDALAAYAIRSLGQFFEIRVGAMEDGARRARSTTLSVGGTGAGTRILSWQPQAPDMPTGAAHPFCRQLVAVLAGS